ncbi:MAG TPA: serine/threonine-protein kinase [Polyangiaceae bacterium]|nr:serine/threonine-protein kinase [Polyangiaceae bacterium]
MSPMYEASPPRPILSLGRYALYGEIAAGGMATVHFGRMSSLGGFSRTVAIKRMRQEIARDPVFVAMFLDEARLTSRIEHPNVVATLDVIAEQGEVFLVMEYIRGESLQRLRRAAKSRQEMVPVPVAVSIMGQVLAGLHAAHEALGEGGTPLGIVHRDVSPQNIMVGEDGISRIMDFGIAKAESRLQITRDGQMKGKLPYMAPEQLSGGRSKIDRRVDIFSSAVVLWELLASRSLFRADHPGETLANVLSAPIPSLTAIRSDIPSTLDHVMQRALSRSPEQRPQTAEQFASELEESIQAGPASPRVVAAWVASLAGEVLVNRTQYVREMESLSSHAMADGVAEGMARGPEPSFTHESNSEAVAAFGPLPPPVAPPFKRSASSSIDLASPASPPFDRHSRLILLYLNRFPSRLPPPTSPHPPFPPPFDRRSPLIPVRYPSPRWKRQHPGQYPTTNRRCRRSEPVPREPRSRLSHPSRSIVIYRLS